MPVPKRLNQACRFFPCHKGLEDCTFCYCPFYPCIDKKLGRYVYSKGKQKKIWSCQDCNFIHKEEIVDLIFALIRENSNLIWLKQPVL